MDPTLDKQAEITRPIYFSIAFLAQSGRNRVFLADRGNKTKNSFDPNLRLVQNFPSRCQE